MVHECICLDIHILLSLKGAMAGGTKKACQTMEPLKADQDHPPAVHIIMSYTSVYIIINLANNS